ncbi:hypothetical protein [Thermosipho melanesiensis]|uniref:hypothetical protein n=1 Tax=Thermosipho melanesiensis TaxID=46541 RepID=UPI0002EF066B|nr:hypothetical protein [Thermosipho melanesiensis]
MDFIDKSIQCKNDGMIAELFHFVDGVELLRDWSYCGIIQIGYLIKEKLYFYLEF